MNCRLGGGGGASTTAKGDAQRPEPPVRDCRAQRIVPLLATGRLAFHLVKSLRRIGALGGETAETRCRSLSLLVVGRVGPRVFRCSFSGVRLWYLCAGERERATCGTREMLGVRRRSSSSVQASLFDIDYHYLIVRFPSMRFSARAATEMSSDAVSLVTDDGVVLRADAFPKSGVRQLVSVVTLDPKRTERLRVCVDRRAGNARYRSNGPDVARYRDGLRSRPRNLASPCVARRPRDRDGAFTNERGGRVRRHRGRRALATRL